MVIIRLPIKEGRKVDYNFLSIVLNSLNDFRGNGSNLLQSLSLSDSFPMVKLITLIKDLKFAQGCSLSGFDDLLFSDGPEITQWIKTHLSKDNYALLLDIEKNVFYLVVRIADFMWLSCWRTNALFTDNDLATIRLVFELFSKTLFRHNETIHAINSSPNGLNALFPSDYESSKHVYRYIIDQLGDPFFFCNEDGNLLALNKTANELFSGYLGNLNDQSGFGWISRIIHPDDMKNIVDIWTPALETKETCSYNCRLLSHDKINEEEIRKHNNFESFCFNITPITDEIQGKLLIWMIHAVKFDGEGDIQGFKKQAHLKGLFLAEMSHEIRTPLACVIGTASLLKYTPLNPEQEELLNTIRLCAQQLFSLINNILDFSKLDQKKLLLEYRPIQLERCINETIDIFTEQLHSHNLDAVVDIAPTVPQWIVSDDMRLRQVLTNLMSNAVKFCRDGGLVKASIECKVTRDAKNELIFCIEDEGVGISNSIHPSKLFESFVQLDSSTPRKYGGTGLGLVICKKLIFLLGGEIWYESVYQKGTKFFFTIKYSEPSDIEVENLIKTVDFVSKKQAIFSLCEYLKSLKSRNLIIVIINMRSRLLNDYIFHILDNIQGLNIQIGNSTISLNSRQDYIVLITDSSLKIPEECIKKDSDVTISDQLHLAIIFLAYSIDTELYGNHTYKNPRVKIRFVKRPIKANLLISAIQECIIHLIMKSSRLIDYSSKGPINEIIPKSPNKLGGNLASKCPLRILVAEDNFFIQQLMNRILQKYGYKDVVFAENGQKALEIVDEIEIDLIFMDMQMPVMNGCEAVIQLRNQSHRQHIIALTANAFNEDREACIKAGMCAYISKPVQWELLQTVISEAYQAITGAIQCICNRTS